MNPTSTAVAALIRPDGGIAWTDPTGAAHHEWTAGHNQARTRIVTRIAAMATQAGQPIPARIEDGPDTWYVSVAPDGMTTAIDPAGFPDLPTPAADDLDSDEPGWEDTREQGGSDAPEVVDLRDQPTPAPEQQEWAPIPAEACQASEPEWAEPELPSIAVSPDVDPWSVDDPLVLLALAADPDPAKRQAAEDVIAADWVDPDTLAGADLDPDHLDRLASSPVDLIAEGVAANPATSPQTLDDLAAHASPHVRAAVARHEGLWPATVTRLSTDDDPMVRAALGTNAAARFVAPARSPRVWARVGVGVAVFLAVLAVVLVGVRLAGGSGAPDVAAAPSVSATTWNGMLLPVSATHGPTSSDGATVSGFSRTDLGGALAAANLSVRIDPYAGPETFVPTITNQTFGGDPAALVTATQDAYTKAADAAGISDGPIPTSTGRIEGWRTDPAVTPETPQTTVHLKVVDPAGKALDFAIVMVWDDGDWKLLDPTRKDTFVRTPASGDYRVF